MIDKIKLGDGISAALRCAKCNKVVEPNKPHNCEVKNEQEEQINGCNKTARGT